MYEKLYFEADSTRRDDDDAEGGMYVFDWMVLTGVESFVPPL